MSDISAEGTVPSDEDFINMLKTQNHWLRNTNLSVTERYSVPAAKRNYTNVTVNCDLATLKLFLEKGSVIYGFAEKKVFEHVSVLQCFNCQRFGHVAANCQSIAYCKFCTGTHASRLCEDKSLKICVNCSRDNKKGGNKNINHRSTDERCPCRSARIMALKVLATKN